jgi:hypothetical protein
MSSTSLLRSLSEHKAEPVADAGLPQPVVLTVYFSGSDHLVTNPETLAGLLFKYNNHNSIDQLTRGFDGCGTVAGIFLGGLFGVGLEGQAREVMRQIQDLNQLGKKVILNCYGHSRGAIAALLLAKMLGKLSVSQVEINLALLDPVPGNLPFTTKIDFLDFTLTNQVLNLSDCQNLRKVLCLYPYKPLFYFAGHAPVISIYPKGCVVEEDVILGCHSQAQFQYIEPENILFSSASFIGYSRILNFLKACGSKYEFKDIVSYSIIIPTSIYSDKIIVMPIAENETEILKDIYQKAHEDFKDTQTRESHSIRPLEIVANAAHTTHLNLHHRQLCPEAKYNGCTLTIKPKNGAISFIRKSPYLYGAIKWFLIGSVIAIELYLNGGLAKLPYLSDLGAWSILPVVPLASLAINISLNLIIKPLLKFSVKLLSHCRSNDKGHYKSLLIEPAYQRDKQTRRNSPSRSLSIPSLPALRPPSAPAASAISSIPTVFLSTSDTAVQEYRQTPAP